MQPTYNNDTVTVPVLYLTYKLSDIRSRMIVLLKGENCLMIC